MSKTTLSIGNYDPSRNPGSAPTANLFSGCKHYDTVVGTNPDAQKTELIETECLSFLWKDKTLIAWIYKNKNTYQYMFGLNVNSVSSEGNSPLFYIHVHTTPIIIVVEVLEICSITKTYPCNMQNFFYM